jgi:hypothetical protein
MPAAATAAVDAVQHTQAAAATNKSQQGACMLQRPFCKVSLNTNGVAEVKKSQPLLVTVCC